MADPVAVTAADIARLAGVTRGTVSNWRRRYTDFPAPVGGTDASPAFDRSGIEAWLAARGALPEASPDDLLWRAVTAAAAAKPLPEVLAWTAELLTELAEGSPPSASPTNGDFAEIRHLITTTLAGRDPEVTLGALLIRYADSAGTSVTPRPVADLMAELADARGRDALDPAAGTGELLEAVLRWGDPDHGPAEAFGQELDPGLAVLSSARVWLGSENGESRVEVGDSLRRDAFPDLRVHAVLCHPPFGSRDWGPDELADDPRWEYGLPARSEPELAWVQHALAHLETGGRAALLMPPAAAARAAGRRIRAALLRRGALRAVISLPAGAVRPRQVPVHLWLLERPGSRRIPDPRVLLVEGAPYAEDGECGTDGWTAFADLARSAWRAFAAHDEGDHGKPGRWHVARAIDLLDEAVDLTPARHVGVTENAASPARTLDEARLLADRLRVVLVGADLEAADVRPGDGALSWPTVALSDLVKRGILEVYRWPGKAEGDSADMTARPGDVLVPTLASGTVAGTVVGAPGQELPDGQFHLIRPDPALLDPWYLAGFLAAPASVQRASYGTAMTRIDARRLTVPVMPLDQQRRYGETFKRLHDLAAALAHAHGLADALTGMLIRSLADGTLRPASNTEPAE